MQKCLGAVRKQPLTTFMKLVWPMSWLTLKSLLTSDPVLNVLVFSPLLTLNKSRETKSLFKVPHWSRSFLEVKSLGIQETGVRWQSLVVDFLVTPTQVSPLSQAVVNNDN